jgi:hypothetical protein
MNIAVTNIPVIPGRFWRVAFWITVIHFVIVGVVVSDGMRAGWREALGTWRLFEWHELGLLPAAALWLFRNSGWIAATLVIADLPAAFLLLKLAIRSPKPRCNVIYLCAVLGTAAIHAAAIFYLAHVGTLQTRSTTHVFDGITPIACVDVVLVLPAILMLAGGVVLGWHGPPAGFCASCGYSLTGNTSGVCPECFTPVPKEPAEESPRTV